jgi:Flp pilus assembly protein TadD
MDPSNLRGLMGLAEIRLQTNEPDKAVGVIAAEVEKEPHRRELRKALGEVEIRANQDDKAIADYQSVVDQYKDSPKEQAEILARLSDAFVRKGDLPHAIELQKKATKLAPDIVVFVVALASLYDRAGMKKDAIDAYQAALKIEPNNAIVLNNLAYILADSGGYLDEALRMALLARRQLPEFKDILDTIGWIYLKKNLVDSAARVFADLVEKYPTESTFHYNYAMALAAQGDRAGALNQVDLALQNHPGKEDETRIKELQRKLS